MMDNPADTQFPIHELMAKRWSPRAFQDRSVEVERLQSCFEAARWAASCFNAQPWTYIMARKEDRANFERLADCLMPGNAWARSAGALILAVASTKFSHNGKPNGLAGHDVGLANAHFVLQATAEGLSVHQMAGFDREKAKTACAIPDDHDPVAILAVGYGGEPDQLSQELKDRELASRTRRTQAEFVFNGTWGGS